MEAGLNGLDVDIQVRSTKYWSSAQGSIPLENYDAIRNRVGVRVDSNACQSSLPAVQSTRMVKNVCRDVVLVRWWSNPAVREIIPTWAMLAQPHP